MAQKARSLWTWAKESDKSKATWDDYGISQAARSNLLPLEHPGEILELPVLVEKATVAGQPDCSGGATAQPEMKPGPEMPTSWMAR